MVIIKALILGDYDALSLNLINRLKKENNQVFVITGNQKKSVKAPPGVFQEYAFSFESDSIAYILSAVKPDVVIYKGVFEALDFINDNSVQMKSVVAGLTNVISKCKMMDVKRFIYLSTTKIFDENISEIIKIESEPKCKLDGQKTTFVGEKILQSYIDSKEMDIVIARLGEVYGVHKTHYLSTKFIASMIKEGLETEIITVDEEVYHNLIYLDDAVDYLYRLTQLQEIARSIHHILPMGTKGFNEKEIGIKLAKLINDDEGMSVKVVSKYEANSSYNHIYEASLDNQLNVYEKYDLDKGLTNFYRVIKKRISKIHEENKEKKTLIDLFKILFFKSSVTALLENIVFFIIIQLFIIFTKDFAFHDSLDIYLIYVIIIAIIYGHIQAIFAVAFSIIGKIYIVIVSTSPYFVFKGYDIYLWIVQIFAVGVLIGYLKEKYRRQFMDYMEERAYLITELDIIKDINESNVRIISEYENRLLNYNNSFARIYELMSRFDVIEPERVIFKAINVISDVMKTKDVSIYSYKNETQYCRMMAASSVKAKSFGKTIKLSDYQIIYNKLLLGEMYVNSEMDEDLPILIGGTYNDSCLDSIIMIWTLPFESFNLYEKNNFGVLCTLIGKTITRAHEYMENINESFNLTSEQILTYDAFSKILQIYSFGEQENVVEYTILKILNNQKLEQDEVIRILKQQVRDTDYIGMNKENKLYVLLTNTNLKESNYVVNRLIERHVDIEIVRGAHEFIS